MLYSFIHFFFLIQSFLLRKMQCLIQTFSFGRKFCNPGKPFPEFITGKRNYFKKSVLFSPLVFILKKWQSVQNMQVNTVAFRILWKNGLLYLTTQFFSNILDRIVKSAADCKISMLLIGYYWSGKVHFEKSINWFLCIESIDSSYIKFLLSLVIGKYPCIEASSNTFNEIKVFFFFSFIFVQMLQSHPVKQYFWIVYLDSIFWIVVWIY